MRRASTAPASTPSTYDRLWRPRSFALDDALESDVREIFESMSREGSSRASTPAFGTGTSTPPVTFNGKTLMQESERAIEMSWKLGGESPVNRRDAKFTEESDNIISYAGTSPWEKRDSKFDGKDDLPPPLSPLDHFVSSFKSHFASATSPSADPFELATITKFVGPWSDDRLGSFFIAKHDVYERNLSDLPPLPVLRATYTAPEMIPEYDEHGDTDYSRVDMSISTIKNITLEDGFVADEDDDTMPLLPPFLDALISNYTPKTVTPRSLPISATYDVEEEATIPSWHLGAPGCDTLLDPTPHHPAHAMSNESPNHIFAFTVALFDEECAPLSPRGADYGDLCYVGGFGPPLFEQNNARLSLAEAMGCGDKERVVWDGVFDGMRVVDGHDGMDLSNAADNRQNADELKTKPVMINPVDAKHTTGLFDGDGDEGMWSEVADGTCETAVVPREGVVPKVGKSEHFFALSKPLCRAHTDNEVRAPSFVRIDRRMWEEESFVLKEVENDGTSDLWDSDDEISAVDHGDDERDANYVCDDVEGIALLHGACYSSDVCSSPDFFIASYTPFDTCDEDEMVTLASNGLFWPVTFDTKMPKVVAPDVRFEVDTYEASELDGQVMWRDWGRTGEDPALVVADDVHIVGTLARIAPLAVAKNSYLQTRELLRASAVVAMAWEEIGPTAQALSWASHRLSDVLEDWVQKNGHANQEDHVVHQIRDAGAGLRVIVTLADYFASLDVPPVCDCAVEFENVKDLEEVWSGVSPGSGTDVCCEENRLSVPSFSPYGVMMFADFEDRDAVSTLLENQADDIAHDENPARWEGFLECSEDEDELCVERFGVEVVRVLSTPDMNIAETGQSGVLEQSQLTLVASASHSMSVPRKLGLVFPDDEDVDEFETAPSSPLTTPFSSPSR
ncbi:hypothetical protein HDU93_002486 [Gonapodya sp. JEL0774]|nr:hypothetical protein HDU93_002486 [Gonapodya sp. JEL0774]